MHQASAVLVAVLCLVAFGGARSAFGAPFFFPPSPYGGVAQSPLNSPAVENFEDGLLNLPGTTVSGGNLATGGCCTDSVEGGSDGHSWYAGSDASLTFTFDATVLGGLPIQAGLVWTDVGFGGSYSSAFVFEAFGPGGVPLGSGVGVVVLGDGCCDTGQQDEDRFFGVYDPSGISAIRITNVDTTDFGPGDWEVDHI
jgi:hypothetical protein